MQIRNIKFTEFTVIGIGALYVQHVIRKMCSIPILKACNPRSFHFGLTDIVKDIIIIFIHHRMTAKK